MRWMKYPIKYPDEYVLPVETVRKCVHCEVNLGSQNPGHECSNCKLIKQETK